MKRRMSSMQPIAAISLTSLMDVTFNLLIAFMMIAPTLKQGMELDLPEVSASTIKPKDTLTVVIRRAPSRGEEERIYIDDKRVSLINLTDSVSGIYNRKKDISVMIEADKTVPYDVVAKVLNAIQKAGVQGVGLVTEPATEK